MHGLNVLVSVSFVLLVFSASKRLLFISLVSVLENCNDYLQMACLHGDSYGKLRVLARCMSDT